MNSKYLVALYAIDHRSNNLLQSLSYLSKNKTDKTFYSGWRGLRSGTAYWIVTNNLTNKVRVQRNPGGGEQLIFTNTRSTAQAMPNNNIDNNGTNQYLITF